MTCPGTAASLAAGLVTVNGREHSPLAQGPRLRNLPSHLGTRAKSGNLGKNVTSLGLVTPLKTRETGLDDGLHPIRTLYHNRIS